MEPERARELLARERERVERELARVQRSPHDDESRLDLADVGTETFEDELDESLEIQLREDLAAIERAEKRLQDGTYGLSVENGQPIPYARLELVPWAERTAEEQERYERGL